MSLHHLYLSSLAFSSTYSAYIYLFSAYLLSIYVSLLCLFPILLHFYLYSSAYICVSSAHFQFFFTSICILQPISVSPLPISSSSQPTVVLFSLYSSLLCPFPVLLSLHLSSSAYIHLSSAYFQLCIFSSVFYFHAIHCSHYISCLSNNIHQYVIQYFYGLSHIVLII